MTYTRACRERGRDLDLEIHQPSITFRLHQLTNRVQALKELECNTRKETSAAARLVECSAQCLRWDQLNRVALIGESRAQSAKADAPNKSAHRAIQPRTQRSEDAIFLL
jgi:hypothetical protein